MSATTVDEYAEQMAAVFVGHQRNGINPCLCGLMRLGESYPGHLVDALRPVLDAALLNSYSRGVADGSLR